MASSSPPDQLTISKRGSIKIGSTAYLKADLTPMQSFIADEVYRLQWKFPHHNIWLVGETIHIWLNRTTNQFHWSDTDAIEAILNAH